MAKEISNLITFNTYKFERGGLLVDMFNQFNARVGDQGTELAIQWETSRTETKINLKERGLHFYAAGSVGQYLEKLEDGTGFKMSADASTVEWEDKDEAGSLDDGITVVKLPKQFFPQKGIFFGYFGLKDRQGNIFTSVNVWFRVLGGVPTMGAAIPYFVTEFDEVLERCNGKIIDALAELREKYQAEVKKNEDMSAETRAALSKLADAVGAIQAQIDAGNVVTLVQHNRDIKALSEMIEHKLAEMNLTPETFPNADAIQTTYPNGKEGLFIAEDTGHKWIYYQGKWADAGIYQGIGIADRSLRAKMTKQFDVLYRVVQAQPIVIDWDKHQLIIAKFISLMEGKEVVDLPEGTYTWDDKLVTIYCGFNATKQQFDFVDYGHINDLPDDDYFIGVFDSASKMISSLFKVTESTSVWHDGTKTLIQNNILPPLQQAICTATDDDIHIDFAKRTLTLYNTLHFYSKTHALEVQPGTFTLNDKGLASFIYATWSDNSDKYVLKAAAEINDVPENSWYLGWIDYYRSSSYFNQIGTNSINKLKRANLTIAGKITVDFDTKEIVFPRNFDGFNFSFKLPKDYQNPVRVPLKVTDGMKDNKNVYYIAVDPKNADQLEISSDYTELSYNCQIIGWINLSAKYYDFKEYGNAADLASQPFIGKKVTCLGDSITSGGVTDNGGQAISYAWYLETLIGTNPTNAGVSGSHITKGTAGRTDSFAERVDSIKGQDLVTIYGGVNDFLFDSPLGVMTDEATTQTTFYGALKYLVTRLTFNNPDAKLLFITPMKADKYGGTYDVNGNVRRNSVNATEEDYVNAIKEVASYYSIPVLDLFHNGNLNPYIPAQNTMTVDGLHPNEKGAQRLAKTIAHAINNL